MKRFLSVLSVIALFVSMQFSTFRNGVMAEIEANIIQGFDQYNSTEEMKASMYMAADSLANGKLELAASGPAASEKSLKIDTHDIAGTGKTADFRLQGFGNCDLTATTSVGIKLWVKSVSATTSTKVFVQLEGSGRASFAPAKNYYLQETNGATSKKTFVTGTRNEGHIQIPAGFEGWAYLPFDALYTGHINNLATFFGLWVCPELDNSPNKTLFMDSIQLFDTMPQQTMIQDFDKYADSTAMLADMSISAITTGKLELAASGPSASEKSLKVSLYDAVNAGSAADFKLKNFGSFNLTAGTTAGVKIWAKTVNATTATKMFVQMIGSGYASFVSGKPYYMQTINGAVSQQLFVTGAVSGTGYMEIPSGFEGWIYLPYSSLYPGHLNYLAACNLMRFCPQLENSVGKTLYMDSVQLFSTVPTRTVIQDFEKYADITAMKADTYVSGTSLANGKLELAGSGASEIGKSLKVTTHDAANAGGSADFQLKNFGTTFDLTNGSSTGVKIWMKSEHATANQKLFIQLLGSGYASFALSRTYYRQTKDGAISREAFARGTVDGIGYVEIPAGFEGWVYLPYSSLYFGHLSYLTSFNAIRVCAELADSPERTLYMDSIQLFNAIPQRASLYSIYSSSMLFQQKKPIVLGGNGEAGIPYTVKLFRQGESAPLQEKTGMGSGDGSWSLTLDAMDGGYDKYDLVLYVDNTEMQRLSNVVFGELWLASGQSNMEYKLAKTPEGIQMSQSGQYGNENVHVLFMPSTAAETQVGMPQKDLLGSYWLTGNDSSVKNVSAVAYWYADNLQKKLNMPVGVMDASLGGTPIYAWMSRESIEGNSDIKNYLTSKGKYIAADAWNAATYTDMTTCYNKKIAPLTIFNISGTIWYQGETNIGDTDGIYTKALNALLQDWSGRFRFDASSMPFVFTHIVPYRYTPLTKLPGLWEDMSDVWKSHPATMAQVPVYDVPLDWDFTKIDASLTNPDPIHPYTKKPIGERLANAAMGLVYIASAEYTAPVVKSSTVSGKYVQITLDHVGDGLAAQTKSGGTYTVSAGTPLYGFAVCGSNNVYVNAKAEITSSNTIRVWSDSVPVPTAATYAFSTINTSSNLVSTLGGKPLFLATPFRTSVVSGTVYLQPKDWVSCDLSKVYHTVGNSPDLYDTWQAAAGSNVTLTFDTATKDEGAASLKAQYTTDANKAFAVQPVLIGSNDVSFTDQNMDYSTFETLKFQVKNAESKPVTITGVRLRVGTDTWYRAELGTSVTQTNIAANANWATVTANLSRLYKEGETGTTVYSSSTLTDVREIQLCFATTEVNAVGTLYLDNFSLGAVAVNTDPGTQEPDDKVLQDFDQYASTTAMKADMFVSSSSLANGKLDLAAGGATTSGKSLKIITHDADNAGKTADFRLQGFGSHNLTATTSAGIKIWVKSTSTTSSTKVFIQLEGSGRASFAPGKVYYLQPTNGDPTQKPLVTGTRAEGHIQIPAGFEGYVYLPFASLYSNHINTLATFYAIWVCPELANSADKALYMDSIQFFDAIPSVTTLQNFDDFANTTEMKSTIHIPSNSPASDKLELVAGGATSGGKSMKITTHDASKAGSTADFRIQSFGTFNLTTTTTEGIKFWVKTTDKTSSTKVFVQLEGSGRASFVSGRAYYLEPMNGEATQQSFVPSDSRTEGHIEIPAKFEGWVYIPYASLYPGHISNLASFNAIWLCPELANSPDRALTIDSIQFFQNFFDPDAQNYEEQGKLIQSFERSDRLIDYKSNVGATNQLGVSIAPTGGVGNSNALKIVNKTNDTTNTNSSTINVSLANWKDNSYRDLSMQDGLSFWLKTGKNSSGSTNSNSITFFLQVDIPYRCHLTPGLSFYMTNKNGKTTVGNLNQAADGNASFTINDGFEGTIYIPFATMAPFSSADIKDTAQAIKMYLYVLNTSYLANKTIYIDNIAPYRTNEIPNVVYPGDHNYNPNNDGMLGIDNKGYTGDVKLPGTSGDEAPGTGEQTALPVALLMTGSAVIAGLATRFVRRKSRKN